MSEVVEGSWECGCGERNPVNVSFEEAVIQLADQVEELQREVIELKERLDGKP